MALAANDIVEIQQLYALYYHEADRGTGDGWAETFVEDGEFRRANAAGGIGDATGAVKGRSALAQINREFVAEFPNYRHWVTNILIDGDDDKATGSCYTMVVDLSEGGFEVVVHGRYDDQLTRTADGWRFVSRVVSLNT